ncbi:MAG TPA: peptidylprolyl isomerase [Prevotella sp.]|nr:peptidylprolyl isomerase [Prevotella sp.]
MLNKTETSRTGRKAMLFMAFCLSSFILLLGSCSESDNTVEEYPDWQNTNVSYWDKLYADTQGKLSDGDASWKTYKSYSIEDSLQSTNTDYIIVNVLTAGKGSGCPIYSDSVRVRYTGQLLPSTSYPQGYVFDTTNKNGASNSTAGVADMKVSDLTAGFATALQHMHIGDQWDVYIPWTLGYGESGNSSIPGYSVLKFKIQLVAYARAGASLPPFK